MDYNKLAKSIRTCVNGGASNGECCTECMLHEEENAWWNIDEQSEHLPDRICLEVLLINAADAIEELLKELDSAKAFSDCWEGLAQDCRRRFETLVEAIKEHDLGGLS